MRGPVTRLDPELLRDEGRGVRLEGEAAHDGGADEERVDVLLLEALDVVEEGLPRLLDQLLVRGLADAPLRESDADDRDRAHRQGQDAGRLHKARETSGAESSFIGSRTSR